MSLEEMIEGRTNEFDSPSTKIHRLSYWEKSLQAKKAKLSQ